MYSILKLYQILSVIWNILVWIKNIKFELNLFNFKLDT